MENIVSAIITGLFGLFTAWYTHHLNSERNGKNGSSENINQDGNVQQDELTIRARQQSKTTSPPSQSISNNIFEWITKIFEKPPIILQVAIAFIILSVGTYISENAMFTLVVWPFLLLWLIKISYRKGLKVQGGCLIAVLIYLIIVIGFVLARFSNN